MHRITRKRAGTGLTLLVSFGLLAAVAWVGSASPAGAAVGSSHQVGIECNTKPGTSPTFTVNTRTGYISLPDGNTSFMWGYALGNAGFQHPGPTMCVNEGDVVTVTFRNNLKETSSIIFPGQTGVTANGQPAQPQFNGSGKLVSLVQTAPANGGSVTYSFTASHPGTFLYESGTDPQKQVQMGLFGALIVRPTGAGFGSNYAYDRTDSRFNPNTEFMGLLSELDPILHSRVETNKAFNMNNYKPRYWLINGRGFPDAIADNHASWLPTQPYGSMAEIQPYSATNPQPALVRYLSVGTEDYPFHPHGNNSVVIARDGRPLTDNGGLADGSFEKFSVPVGPGQTWDVLFQWQDDNSYSTSNEVPVTVPNLANLEVGMFYGGTPYLGVQGTLPPGFSSQNECGEFYILAHNHALHQITSWGGFVMTGPITYTRVDPPLPNSCP